MGDGGEDEPAAGGSGVGLGRRLFKPLYLVHYALLFGRRFPFAAALERRVRRWELATGRGDAPLPQEAWDSQYAAGRWDVMRELDELPRYGALAAYLHRLHPAGAVLDVGCGEGILLDHLPAPAAAGYTGIDLSRTAIDRARERHPGAELVVGDAERWEPARTYDAIVLNECVYYFERPLEGALRWRRWLADGGTLLVSAFRTRRSDVIRRRLAAVWPASDEVTIRGRKGTWVVTLHRAADARPAAALAPESRSR